ncbi:hypothetical protein FNV43_RR00678 [Rhamnella rubrinervis]|uniref:Uncharacterized protein n=1 Tax=Rhamnella rubrinervis TaxID=2594499 RepID=A0A8K0MSM8_9ROSA|nr:hypothetical protein FNV43_RR00678 [Rhamnella rubrinervis]
MDKAGKFNQILKVGFDGSDHSMVGSGRIYLLRPSGCPIDDPTVGSGGSDQIRLLDHQIEPSDGHTGQIRLDPTNGWSDLVDLTISDHRMVGSKNSTVGSDRICLI